MSRHGERRPAAQQDVTAPQRPPVRRVVQAGLKQQGEPLPAAVRATMESRFGQGFGDVRLHTDPSAAASALALGARAYTVGRDIVFSPGAMAPGSAEGEELLAHELAHAALAGPGAAGAEAEHIDAPGSSEEHQAERAADAVAAGRPVGPMQAAAHGGVVHRSLLGAGLGGLIGGVGLGLLGGLLGPVGAVVGAVVAPRARPHRRRADLRP